MLTEISICNARLFAEREPFRLRPLTVFCGTNSAVKSIVLMIGDIAAPSEAAFFSDRPPETRPRCPTCDVPVHSGGEKARHLRAHGEQQVPLRREHAVCPQCGEAFFPPG